MTTVGYGDMYPETLGKIDTVLLSLSFVELIVLIISVTFQTFTEIGCLILIGSAEESTQSIFMTRAILYVVSTISLIVFSQLNKSLKVV